VRVLNLDISNKTTKLDLCVKVMPLCLQCGFCNVGIVEIPLTCHAFRR